MHSHYDFIKAVRGKHAKSYARGTNRITLDPDNAAVFPDAKSVNDALRSLIRIALRQRSAARKRRAD